MLHRDRQGRRPEHGRHQPAESLRLSLGKLAGMCGDEDVFRVGTTGKSIVFFKENFLFSARLMEGGYIDTDSLLKTITNSFTVLTDTKEMREALSSVHVRRAGWAGAAEL